MRLRGCRELDAQGVKVFLHPILAIFALRLPASRLWLPMRPARGAVATKALRELDTLLLLNRASVSPAAIGSRLFLLLLVLAARCLLPPPPLRGALAPLALFLCPFTSPTTL